MPTIARQTLKMDCAGLDLISPLDKMSVGHFPYLANVRVQQEGRIESRPGYTPFNTTPLSVTNLHTIRRLNDVSQAFAAAGYIYVVGNDTTLWGGTENALAQIDSGYSGNPLSLITFRPENSPNAFMYVYDQQRQVRVRPDGAVFPIGVTPPVSWVLQTEVDYGAPAMVDLDTGQSATGWTAGTGFGSITLKDRQQTGGANDGSISTLAYNSGTTGWCVIVPSNPINYAYAGPRMKVILNTGGGNQETVMVREIHPAIATTTVQAIQYDIGSTGLCSVVLTNSPAGLARNAAVIIGGNLIRILAVIPSPDGTTYSIRINTTSTVAAGATVTGAISWYTYTTATHAAGESLTTNCVYAGANTAAAGTYSIGKYYGSPIDASKANNRAIDPANDWMHISFWATNAVNLTGVNFYIDVDASTSNLATAFQDNYYVAKLTPAQVFGTEPLPGNFQSSAVQTQANPAAPATNAQINTQISQLTSLNTAYPTSGFWYEIVIPLSMFTRVGNDLTRNLSTIAALKIEIISQGGTNQTDIAFDWWYLFGTYGPTIQPNSPVGYLYEARFRDSTTGAASVPGPPTRYTLNPLREEVLVTPNTTTAPEVDYCDVYRQGGSLSQFTFDGTVPNNTGSPNTFADVYSDNSLLSNPPADLTQLQPWPIQQLPWTGTVNVIGTSVIWQSGNTFNKNLVAGTIILINGIAYQFYGNPRTTTFIELTASAGVLNGATFLIASPILAAQPLPFAFGPLEGPFSPVAFGIGDPLNPGTLYWTNAANLDGASDVNTLEISPPSEPLVSGATWNGLVFVGSRDNIYLVRYTFLPSPGQAGSYSFQFQRIPSPSGMWARWACCRGQDGVYFLGRDGIYRANEQGVVSITDPFLYPLFPHDGQNLAVNANVNNVNAPDMTQLPNLRLSACDNDIYFDYVPL